MSIQKEVLLTIKNDEGISIRDLANLTRRMSLAGFGDTIVALCLSGIETHTTRIVEANNEGDNSRLWLHLDAEASELCVNGINRGIEIPELT